MEEKSCSHTFDELLESPATRISNMLMSNSGDEGCRRHWLSIILTMMVISSSPNLRYFTKQSTHLDELNSAYMGSVSIS